jgi:transcriptional regulator with XRE-family HTH domain
VTSPQTYSFGEWIKQRRGTIRLTQRELAVDTHCSVPMLKKIESDERRPSPELARLRLALAAWGVTRQCHFGGISLEPSKNSLTRRVTPSRLHALLGHRFTGRQVV